MKQTGNELLCNINFYNAMLQAYANGQNEFEYGTAIWKADDILESFVKDIKRGKLNVVANINI